jgi:heme/copper-type cytochrome/quinol oxidase subunit 1
VPRLSCWFIRASLVYLATGLTLGALLLIHKGIPLHAALWRVLPAHMEFLLLGWTLQLAMGMAFWMLPRFQGERTRGNEALAWWAFGLLNSGACLVGLSWMLEGPAWVPLLGRLLETAAALAFVAHAWPRVKASAT